MQGQNYKCSKEFAREVSTILPMIMREFSKTQKSNIFSKIHLTMPQMFILEFLGEKETLKTGMISLSLILTFALGYFVLRPVNISYRNTKINIENLKAEKQTLLEKKSKLKDLERIIEENTE